MYFEKTGQNFDDFPAENKRGTACRLEDDCWTLDKEMPILREENRPYIDSVFEKQL